MLRWFCLVLCYVYNFTLLACTSSFLKLSLILNIQKTQAITFLLLLCGPRYQIIFVVFIACNVYKRPKIL